MIVHDLPLPATQVIINGSLISALVQAGAGKETISCILSQLEIPHRYYKCKRSGDGHDSLQVSYIILFG